MSYEDQDADDILLAAGRSGSPAAQFPSVGSIVEGYVTARPRKTEQRDVDGKAKTFDDGTVRMQVLIELQTELRSPDIKDDTGARTLWCKWEIQKAISAAMMDAGVKRVEVGGFLQVGRTQDEPPAKRGYKPTQKFVAKYTPPAVQAADDMFATASTSPAPAFSGPPAAKSGVVFENQHQDHTAPPAQGMTTLDQLKNTSFNAQGSPQDQAPPF